MPVPGPSSDRRSEASPREELEAFIEKVVDSADDDGNRQLAKQIIVGGLSGWLTGFVCQKVGKVAATAIGGGIIILQIAHHKGYIKVNWSRVNRDFENVTTKIQKEAFGKKKLDWSDKVRELLRENSYGTLSFMSGVLIGLAS